MGTIAARDCIRNLELAEQVFAASLIASVQAIDLRQKSGALPSEKLKHVQETLDQVHEKFVFLQEDRPLEKDLRLFVDLIRERHWKFSF